MRHLVWIVATAAFASGLIGAWAFTQVTERAGAAPPPPRPQATGRLQRVPDRARGRHRQADSRAPRRERQTANNRAAV
jgi:hypothetical protein